MMVVVEDLATWEKNPVQPKDPIGNQRQFVQKWTAADFANDDEFVSAARSIETGKRIFTEATCAQCHRLGDFGGVGANVGPALDDLYLDGSVIAALFSSTFLTPSDHVDEKYRMYIVATDDGLTRSGLLVSENDDFVEKFLRAVRYRKTTRIPRDEIEEMAESTKSIHAKGSVGSIQRKKRFWI